ncbi:PilZ domain-containing protein [Geodermatophilus sabuli]|uniref:PilZ domain-containing protein n=1 Tax=Geodermatophilus sabuli TaxID=1564158 RepID=A0A7K3W5W8_9ACTN|nr:PilZ domain-containing protein [Geodermatophilus sabuli]NEK60108.1 PilZ domain-containing protein [Geodermatophilus sabuli]
MTSPGVAYPRQDAEVEVTACQGRLSVSARTESAAPTVLVVRPSASEFVDQAVVRVGEQVSVFWQGPEGGRAFPAVISTVERGAAPRWHLQVSGPAEDSQRRTAVRARVALPLTATVNGGEATGRTLDLSEAGTRAVLEGWGTAPETGTRLQLSLELEDGALVTPAEVARQQSRGTQWVMSLCFAELPEKEQDRLRRRVFQALREERARQSD